MPTRAVFRCQFCDASPDHGTQRSLQGQVTERMFGEYLDAFPGRWLVWNGGGPLGPRRYACREHRGDLVAYLRYHYATVAAQVWKMPPYEQRWPDEKRPHMGGSMGIIKFGLRGGLLQDAPPAPAAGAPAPAAGAPAPEAVPAEPVPAAAPEAVPAEAVPAGDPAGEPPAEPAPPADHFPAGDPFPPGELFPPGDLFPPGPLFPPEDLLAPDPLEDMFPPGPLFPPTDEPFRRDDDGPDDDWPDAWPDGFPSGEPGPSGPEPPLHP